MPVRLAGFPPRRGRRFALFVLLATAAPASPQGFPLLPLAGPGIGDQFGVAVAGLGDVDADGVPDLLVGARFANPGGLPFAGQARVLSGASGALLYAVGGSASGENLASCVAALGDLDADGIADFLLGAPYADPSGLVNAGRASVHSGANGTLLFGLDGGAAGDNFGFSGSAAGDVSGDGIPDFVVGAPLVEPGVFNNAGRARVFSGAGGAILLTFDGAAAFDYLGWSVGGAGDVDGDLVPDLAVGAIGVDVGTLNNAGRVRVYSGAGGAVLYTLDGWASGISLGCSVAGAGDLTSDGLAEVIAGALSADPGGLLDAGEARVLSGPAGALLHSLAGSAAGEFFGYAVAAGPDLDGDGRPELLVGAPGIPLFPSGSAYGPGAARVFSGTSGAALFAFAGAAANDSFGASLSSAGDVDGDGLGDLLVGSPRVTAVPQATGCALVLSVAGLPAGATAFGTGCAGTGGVVPAFSTYGGPPAVGNASFGLAISKGRGGAIAFPFLSIGSVPAGIPILGCDLYLLLPIVNLPPASVLSGPSGAGGVGHRLRPLPIPPDPVFAGLTVYLEVSVLDRGSGNALFTTTNALTLTVQ